MLAVALNARHTLARCNISKQLRIDSFQINFEVFCILYYFIVNFHISSIFIHFDSSEQLAQCYELFRCAMHFCHAVCIHHSSFPLCVYGRFCVCAFVCCDRFSMSLVGFSLYSVSSRDPRRTLDSVQWFFTVRCAFRVQLRFIFHFFSLSFLPFKSGFTRNPKSKGYRVHVWWPAAWKPSNQFI